MVTKKKVKKNPKIKEPVKIRFKKLANGNQSIYLDYYHDGKREYDFLKLYILPEHTPADKASNQHALSLANSIKAKRIVALQNESHGFKTKASKKVNLCLFIQRVAEEQLAKTGNRQSMYHSLLSLIRHITTYKGDSITFAQVDEDYLKGFISYLKTATNKAVKNNPPIISQNTQNKLYNKLCYILSIAEREGVIFNNPANKIATADKPKAKEGEREYLTVNELKQLIRTDCKNPQLKHAYLFCSLTGIRFSDAKIIKWADIRSDNAGEAELQFRMKKTGRLMYLPVSKEALKWLPDQNDAKDEDLVYSLPRNDHANDILKQWVKDAKIKKKITFHCSRHTAATLNLSLGVPLEVVSKLLGHTKISTTQIYAKIVSEARREAVDKQNGILDL
ncbi:MAG: site-specific integrase [Bacteroidales bacterium]|nr:site-specific integrase [Bacteroidales bacterium]MDD3010221.1 site-specific integrase [Bacteroidales bacterium]MDY0285823.1 site-specific integrase [Bacteroidales bacterium]HPE87680.1 site-specific integrase [Bacteroidales bacterium]